MLLTQIQVGGVGSQFHIFSSAWRIIPGLWYVVRMGPPCISHEKAIGMGVPQPYLGDLPKTMLINHVSKSRDDPPGCSFFIGEHFTQLATSPPATLRGPNVSWCLHLGSQKVGTKRLGICFGAEVNVPGRHSGARVSCQMILWVFFSSNSRISRPEHTIYKEQLPHPKSCQISWKCLKSSQLGLGNVIIR